MRFAILAVMARHNEKVEGIEAGLSKLSLFSKKKENGECVFQMNLNYSNDRGPMYLRKLQYPLTSMKNYHIHSNYFEICIHHFPFFLENKDNFESPTSIPSTFS